MTLVILEVELLKGNLRVGDNLREQEIFPPGKQMCRRASVLFILTWWLFKYVSSDVDWSSEFKTMPCDINCQIPCLGGLWKHKISVAHAHKKSSNIVGKVGEVICETRSESSQRFRIKVLFMH